MKKYILICIVLFLMISCDKEKNPENKNIITVMDTLQGYWPEHIQYSLDINADSIKDIEFDLGVELGGTYFYEHAYITGINDTKIAYIQKYDTTWTYIAGDPFYKDTVWYYHSFEQVRSFNIGDTICDGLDFSNEQLTIAEIADPHADFWPDSCYTYIDRKDLIGEIIYIGIKLRTGLAWVKIEVLSYASIVIHKYGYINESNELIIKE